AWAAMKLWAFVRRSRQPQGRPRRRRLPHGQRKMTSGPPSRARQVTSTNGILPPSTTEVTMVERTLLSVCLVLLALGAAFAQNARARDVKLVGDRFKPLTYDEM